MLSCWPVLTRTVKKKVGKHRPMASRVSFVLAKELSSEKIRLQKAIEYQSQRTSVLVSISGQTGCHQLKVNKDIFAHSERLMHEMSATKFTYR